MNGPDSWIRFFLSVWFLWLLSVFFFFVFHIWYLCLHSLDLIHLTLANEGLSPERKIWRSQAWQKSPDFDFRLQRVKERPNDEWSPATELNFTGFCLLSFGSSRHRCYFNGVKMLFIMELLGGCFKKVSFSAQSQEEKRSNQMQVLIYDRRWKHNVPVMAAGVGNKKELWIIHADCYESEWAVMFVDCAQRDACWLMQGEGVCAVMNDSVLQAKRSQKRPVLTSCYCSLNWCHGELWFLFISKCFCRLIWSPWASLTLI